MNAYAVSPVYRVLLAMCCAVSLIACSKQESEQAGPRPVSTVVAAYDAGAHTWQVPAQIDARASTPLSFRVNGKIIRRTVGVGDRVLAGQVLAELDVQPLQLNLDSTQAQLDAARQGLAFATKQWQRDQKQARADLISQAQLEQSRNAYAQAQAQFTQAQKAQALAADRVAYARLTSAHEGIITAEQAETGQNVSAGQPVYTLAWGDEMDVLCDVPERQVGMLDVGQSATVELTAFPRKPYRATVREIAPAADPMSRSFRVKLRLLEATPHVRLGMTATVRFDTSDTLQASGDTRRITLPATALFHDDGNPAVWIVQENTLALRAVTIAAYGADTVTLSGGVEPGERVLAQGVHTVSAGQEVRVVQPSDAATPVERARRADPVATGAQQRAGAHP
ncbi:efflux RND transporter periplasmic adaptor subunit [Allopusillimonas ginsengisoli]|uniref:efflux RND transporter periplasmic adaptor subunit n=1 Tax=Allopusillimonas ginsengisoli TaxID=453575 RepID=UPI00101FBBA2|nr:efflux RND transporter periplasmic adaptor subunit [Allopusillimonas ginsengisoli]TEA77797.1 efflux RND transporter periplasmic adaptor subunit [Allopusillimonas ginsengisoli]